MKKSECRTLYHETIKPTVKKKIIAYYMTFFYNFMVLAVFIGAIMGTHKLSVFLANLIAIYTSNPDLYIALIFIFFIIIIFLIAPLIGFGLIYFHEKAEIGKYQDLLDKLWHKRSILD